MVRKNKSRASALAILLISSSVAKAANWSQTGGGSFAWNSNANWGNTTFPNGAGAVANLNVGLTGALTTTLSTGITLGQLNVGDSGGTAGVKTTISGNTLTFQGTSPGSSTAINLTASGSAGGANMITLPNVNVAANSPLTITANATASTEVFNAIGTFNIGSNNVTLTGQPVTDIEIVDTVTGALWIANNLAGSGNITINGSGLEVDNNSPSFTGTITITNGQFSLYSGGNVSAASQYVVQGAWNETFVSPNDNKYPIGGLFKVGNPGSPVYSSIQPSRLNPNAPMIFRGGFFEYLGQALTANFTGTNLVEQLGQMQFVSGMSEIRMQDGNLQAGQPSTGTQYVCKSSTLLVTNATNACVRLPGATVMVGGDDNTSRDGTFPNAMGVAEKLVFASGMSQYLKGAGGADGTMSKSIIPWMTDGTIYHPGQGLWMTYDNTNGVRCLTASEYYYLPDADNGSTIQAANPTYNVSSTSNNAGSGILNLGAGHSVTINSLQDQSRSNSDLGAGSTLTITSGGIEFNGPGKIGQTRANSGTINFGTAEGIIWTDQDCEYGDTAFGNNLIGSVIAGSGGLTIAGKNRILLTNANTYTGKTYVGSGILQIGDGTVTDAKLGAGDLDVSAGATLTIAAHIANGISDTAAVSLQDNGDQFYGMINLATGINETVGRLFLNGVVQPTGTYGSTSSSAANKNNTYFAGAGILTSTPNNLFWNNQPSTTGNGTAWDGGLGGTSQNWTNAGSASLFYFGDNVTFNDTNNGHYNVALSTTLLPASVAVNNSSGNYEFSGTGGIGGSTGLTKSGTGSLTLQNANTYTGATNVNAGTLIVNAVGALPTNTSLSILATAAVTVDRGAGSRILVQVNQLTLGGSTGNWTGRLDLKNNDLIVHNGNFANILNQVKQGYTSGSGPSSKGILSSTAAGDGLHTLGVVTNSTASFDGTTLLTTDVAVKYTYYGDANLSGTVDGSDYTLIDAGFGHATTWQGGDFNYDGVVNGSDYTLIDNAFNMQTAGLAAEVADQMSAVSSEIATGAGTAVPEPGALCVMGICAVSLLARRRRR